MRQTSTAPSKCHLFVRRGDGDVNYSLFHSLMLVLMLDPISSPHCTYMNLSPSDLANKPPPMQVITPYNPGLIHSTASEIGQSVPVVQIKASPALQASLIAFFLLSPTGHISRVAHMSSPPSTFTIPFPPDSLIWRPGTKSPFTLHAPLAKDTVIIPIHV